VRRFYDELLLPKLRFARQHPLLSAVSVLLVLAVYALVMYLAYHRRLPGFSLPCSPACGG
jgi:hypothetical protein